MILTKFPMKPSILLVFLVLISATSAVEYELVSTYDTCEVTVTPSAVITEPIDDQLKAECSEVTDLYVRGQGLLLVPTGYCSVLPNLTRFVVEGTPANRLADAFKEDGCQFVKYLLLSGNKLSELPVAAFRTLKSLDNLELAYNQLDNLVPDTFIGLPQLTTLGLSYNGISRVPVDLFKHLPSLEIVSLSGNNLKNLDLNLFSTNPQLVGLSCNECGLTSILPSTTQLRLETLQLRTNRLTNIAVLNEFTSLNGLELTENADLMLNDVEFSTFPNLTSMDLGKVSLNRRANYQNILPPTLTYLYIHGNALGTIDLEQLGHLKKLQYLNIEDNGLKALDFERIPLIFPKLTQIEIGKNGFSKEQEEVMKEFFITKDIDTYYSFQ